MHLISILLILSLHLHHSINTISQNSVQSQAKQLLSLLSPTPALGEPWPTIPGPDLKDRVCIVGAGPAGVHMALSLKKRGYQHVILFEKSIRVGGKCFDINYRGTPQAQGANYLTANHFEDIVPLLKEYGLDDLVPVSSIHMWTTNSASDRGSQLTPRQFTLSAMSKLTNSTSPYVNIGFYLKTVKRYIKLHKEMFGLYEGDLMQRPSTEVMYRIRGTILDFLTRENLLGMVPMFQITQTLAGYGQLDEIGALYALMWHNPKLVISLVLEAIKQDTDLFSIFSLKDGFEKIWKTIVEKENLNVHFHTDIVNIKRRENNIYLETWQNDNAQTEACNFLIWTPHASELLKVLKNPTSDESQLLGSLKQEIFYAQLINIEGGVRHAPTAAFLENILSKEPYGVTWAADMAGLLTGIKTKEEIDIYNEESGLRTLYTIHAPAKMYTSEAYLRGKTRKHFVEGFNVTNIEFLNTVPWSYFPRWTPEEVVEGRHWDVFAMQGRNKIWYAGESASFPSTRSVISYNQRLLKQMVPRSTLVSNFHQGFWPFNQNEKDNSNSQNFDNCKYSCSAGGGCKVWSRGYTLGSCMPGGGKFVGTPRDCQDCNKVVNC